MSNLVMSMKEIKRLSIINKVLNKEMNGTEAGKLLKLSSRQIRRIKKRVNKSGPKGLIHGLRGQVGNRALSSKLRQNIEDLLVKNYADFKPTFACEKLKMNHSISVDPKTIRTLMTEIGLWNPRSKRTKNSFRAWRARKGCFGEMQQFDGSYHNWFEGRLKNNEENCLLASIDDATGQLTYVRFSDHEGVIPVFSFWNEYIQIHGVPHSIYLDKFSTYHMNHKEAQNHPDTLTQFQRLTQSLGIDLITANSPQAKGRVERLFQTLQDRLVKELRLQNISTIEKANEFLMEKFIPEFNLKFSVKPDKKINLHRKIKKLEMARMDSAFSRQTLRKVNNDFTINFKKEWFQLVIEQPVTVCKKDTVVMAEHMDGSLKIQFKGHYLNYKKLPARPIKTFNQPWVLAKTKSMKKTVLPPPKNHPWRKFAFSPNYQNVNPNLSLTRTFLNPSN